MLAAALVVWTLGSGTTAAQVFSENFDGVTSPALPAGWTATVTTGPGSAAWVTTSASSDTASNSAFAPGPSITTNTVLDSPDISLGEGAHRLTFRHRYTLEAGWDGGVLEIKIGSGSFTDIISAGGSFVQGGYVRAAGALGDRLSWSGGSSGYVTTIVTLPSSAAGKTIRLRWRLATDSSVASTGWNVDTVQLTQGFSPTISDIANQTTNEDTETGALAFTIGDDATSAGALTLSAQSSNTTLVPVNNIAFGGSDANRTVTVTPAANQSGTATITITVADADGITATDSFVLTVTAVNDLPTLSDVADQTTNEDTATSAIAFTIGDVETAAASLTLSAQSSNTTLLPVANVAFGGSGANRTVTVTPAANQSGTATITITVTDADGGSVNDTFVLTVTEINDPPTITSVANQTLTTGASSAPLPFTISDVETPNSLSVTAATSNAAVVPLGNVTLAGAGASRTVAVTGQSAGVAVITLAVSDGVLTRTISFTVTVEDAPSPSPPPGNAPPQISTIANQVVARGTITVGPLSFTVSDDRTPASSLTVQASSSNTVVVPAHGMTLTGSGADRSITLTLPADASGDTTVTLTANDGELSSSTSFVVSVSGPPVPRAPLDLRAAVRGRNIDLSWRMAASDGQTFGNDAPTSFRIEIGSAPDTSNVAVFTTGVTTAFTVAELAAGRYFIRVRGVNEAGLGAASNEVDVSIATAGPEAPRNLRATVSDDTIRLDWDSPTFGSVAEYRVEAGTHSGSADLGVVSTLDTFFIATGLANGVYHMRVRSIGPAGETGASNEVAVTVGAPPCTAPPPVPLGLAVQAVGSIISVYWLAPTDGVAVERYDLEVGTAPGLRDRGTYWFAANTTAVGGAVEPGTYVFRLRAANGCGLSAETSEVSITIGGAAPELPDAPMNVAGSVSGDTVVITWDAPATGGAPTRYVIEATDAAGAAVAMIDTGNPSTMFMHSAVGPGTYVVRIRAANGAGTGPPSAAVSITVP